MCETQSAGFKWEHTFLSNSILILVAASLHWLWHVLCCSNGTPRGYSQFHEGELWLGLGWCCLNITCNCLYHPNICIPVDIFCMHSSPDLPVFTEVGLVCKLQESLAHETGIPGSYKHFSDSQLLVQEIIWI